MTNKNTKLTDTHKRYIKMFRNKLSHTKMAKKLGVKKWDINYFVTQEGIKKDYAIHTKEQKNFIRDNYETMTDHRIAIHLGVRKMDICNYRNKEGYFKRNKEPKGKLVDGIFDVDSKINWVM